MAGKRAATSELNEQNWNAEEKPEDSGTFKRASEEVIQKRNIKTAKRRNPISSSSESPAKNIFGSFTAFNKTPTTSTAFSFLNNLTASKDTSAVNGVNNSSPNIFTQPSNIDNSVTFKGPENNTLNNEMDEEYYAKLKGLNESVSSWIKIHVDKNPFINLKPIFKDYEKYFDELESLKTNKLKSVDNVMHKSSDVSNTFKKELSSFQFKSADVSKDGVKDTATSSFGANAGTKATGVTVTTAPSFSFGSGSSKVSNPTFSFGSDTKASSNNSFIFGSPSTKPFTFANVSKPTNNEETSEDKEEDEPPKVEFTPVVEDGHTYTVRCKLFVKNQNSFGDRGVGTLYLKPVPDSEKIQLIVRADTNLGNLLCNFILSKSIPLKRMGKKDVMLVCLPTLESKPPPVPILLRVKSPEQADELFSQLEKHQK